MCRILTQCQTISNFDSDLDKDRNPGKQHYTTPGNNQESLEPQSMCHQTDQRKKGDVNPPDLPVTLLLSFSCESCFYAQETTDFLRKSLASFENIAAAQIR